MVTRPRIRHPTGRPLSRPAALAALTALFVVLFIASGAFAVPPVTPVFDSANFDHPVANAYFPLVPGTQYTYRSDTPDGTEIGHVLITRDRKSILGVSAIVVRDSVFLNGELKELTFDWYAYDNFGNAWYLGEDSKQYLHGVEVGHEGSWKAGTHGAVAGIIMKANPVVGEKYRQEFRAGSAEDVARVENVDETVLLPVLGTLVPFVVYQHCIRTRDWSRLDPGVVERKYYAPGVGVILEVERDDEGVVTLNRLVSRTP